MTTAQNPALQPLLCDEYTLESLARIRSTLEAHGTLDFPVLRTGLFSAATVSDFSKKTNYHAAWIRDNVHVAYAHFANGKSQRAVGGARALARFLEGQRPRFDAIIADPSRKSDPMQRPHVRFDGDSYRELDQSWSHAQNDALGAFLWFFCKLVLDGALALEESDVETLARFPRYLRAIKFWEDQDSGHWEEVRKVSASSIGAVIAGLHQLRNLVRLALDGGEEIPGSTIPETLSRRIRDEISADEISDLVQTGEAALYRILPKECVEPGKTRLYDAALLFLVYPLGIVDDAMAKTIVEQTEKHLRGKIGIKRYLGDSFYCSDYESLMARRSDDPTRNFSEDIGARDALLTAGGEAEWCLFDPIISVYYGRRFRQERSLEALSKQTEYLNRSLAQITRADRPRCEAYRCPELYYQEHGRLQTSRSTPLLWTQANLWTALESMRQSLAE